MRNNPFSCIDYWSYDKFFRMLHIPVKAVMFSKIIFTMTCIRRGSCWAYGRILDFSYVFMKGRNIFICIASYCSDSLKRKDMFPLKHYQFCKTYHTGKNNTVSFYMGTTRETCIIDCPHGTHKTSVKMWRASHQRDWNIRSHWKRVNMTDRRETFYFTNATVFC